MILVNNPSFYDGGVTNVVKDHFPCFPLAATQGLLVVLILLEQRNVQTIMIGNK
jgi:hypothetical protein